MDWRSVGGGDDVVGVA